MATTFDENGTNTPNGSHLEFSYTFDVIKNEDVKVALNGVTQAATKYTLDTTTNPKKIIFNNTSVDASVQESTGAPKTGVVVKVYRDTDVDAARVDFQPGSGIRAADLNTNQKQVLYALQEEQNQKGIFESISLDDDVQIKLGNSDDFTIEWDTAGSPDAGVLKAASIDIKADNFKIRDSGGNQLFHADNTQILVSENFRPTSDNTFDLGSSGGQWKDLYVNGVAYLDEIDLGDDQKLKFGDNDDFTIYWKNSTSDAKLESDNDIIYDSGSGHKFTKDGASVLTLWSSAADFKVHVRPWNDDTWDLGSSSYQWRNLYVDGTGYIDTIDSEALTVSGTSTLATVDINGGAIDGTTIGASSATTGKFTQATIDYVEIDGYKVDTTSGDLHIDSATSHTIIDGNLTVVGSTTLAAGSIGNSEIADNAVTSAKIADNAVGNSKLVTNAVATANIQAGNITNAKIADNAINARTIEANAVGASELADNAVDTAAIADDAVTTAKIADAELKVLAGMAGGTASKLADSTPLTADIADLNQIDGLTKQTTISDSDASFPTSGAVVDYVASQLDPVGGLEVIATDAAFPNTQPASGVVVSIADAGGLVVNGSGVSTTGRTVGGSTVTINNINSQFNSTTIDNGVAMMVSSTGSGQTYNYHKATLREQDILSISSDIQSFGNRYRVGSSNPTSDNDAGDLFFNTATDKLLVRNAANNSWDEAQSVGNFYISTLSPAFDGSTTDFTITNAPTYASQILLIINGVLQKPNAGTSAPADGFALDGSTVKLGGAPATGSTYSAVVIGSTVNIGTPSDNTVSAAVLQSGSVTTAKIAADAVDGTKIADDAVGAEHIEVLDAALQFGDSVKAQFGTGNDLEIYHDGSHSFVDGTTTGDLYLRSTNDDIILSAADDIVLQVQGSETGLRCNGDGAVQLYYDGGSAHFQTESYGNQAFGEFFIGDGDGSDASNHIRLGNGGDLKIYHNGTNNNNFITNAAGKVLYFYGDDFSFKNAAADETLLSFSNGYGVNLYHDNDLRLATWSDGVNIYGDEGEDAILHLYADDGDDNADKWRITSTHVGNSFTIQSYASGSWQSVFKGTDARAAELHYQDNKKLETYNEGTRIHGYLHAQAAQSDSHWGESTSNIHIIHNEASNHALALFEHSHSSTPWGIEVGFTNAQPDNNTQTAYAFWDMNASDQTTMRFKVYTDGDVWNHDDSYNESDATLKENIVDATPKLEDLKKLKVRNFNWKSEYFPEKSKKKQLGFIAQEVEEVFPALVTEHDISGNPTASDHVPVMKKAIKQAWDPIIIKAMQELIAKVETLETKVAALEAK